MHKQKHQQVLCHTQSRAFFFFHQDVSVKINAIMMAQTITSDTAEAAALHDFAIAVPLRIVLTIDFT